ncbi:MAG: ArgE/DapE family deacylase [Candidatus Promineifilaceae bacterium]
MNELEKKALDAIDIEGMLAYLDEFVAVQSLDGQESAAQRHVAAKMRELGLDVDEWEIDLDAVRQHPSYCEEVFREEGLGVVGSMGKGNGRSLILNGHVDVVPAGELENWTVDPWRATVKDGKVFGRGALDMKGGLCCALFAAKAIRDAGIELDGKLMIQAVIGEEDGGVGALATCLRGYSADAAIIMEPTELMIAPAQAGALNFRITVPGHAAHGAMRLEGVSAIEKFMPLYNAIMAYEAERNATIKDVRFADYELPYPICVGTIQAGNWASTVAESLTFEGRFGVAVDEDTATARRAFEAVVQAAADQDAFLAVNRPTVEWWGGQFEAAGIDPSHPIVGTVSDAFSELTGNVPIQRGMTYGADMRLLVHHANTPTIMFGPGDVRKAHQPDEYVPLDDLIAVVKTLTLTVLRTCL